MRAKREDWLEAQDELDPDRLVFIDETATATNMARRYGRAPRGQRCRVAVPHGHYKTTTVTAGLRASGLTALSLLDGAMNGERFRVYVEQVLVPTLKPGDTVILDNLPAHKVAGVRQSLAAVGARLLYLPSYSPEPKDRAATSTRSSRSSPSSKLCCARSPPAPSRPCARPSGKRWHASPRPSAETTLPPPDTKQTWPLLHDRTQL